jgi:hypothetical protein
VLLIVFNALARERCSLMAAKVEAMKFVMMISLRVVL